MKMGLFLIFFLGFWLFIEGPITHAQEIKSEAGSVAIGGNVTGSTIVIGIPPNQLEELIRQHKDYSESQKKLIENLQSRLEINERQIITALNILGEANVAPENLATKLVEVAERLKSLQATASIQVGDNTRVTALKADAQKAIDAGDLAKADVLLSEIEREQRTESDRLAVNLADTLARRGEIAMARLRYIEASKHFAEAVARLPAGSDHDDKRFIYLQREAGALQRQGTEFGDNSLLASAILRYTRLVDMRSRERSPNDWAVAQNNLATALSTLGERESGTSRLEEAVQAYREALKVQTRDRTPFAWAMIQTNLGQVLVHLGERENSAPRFEEAVRTYREALKALSRDRIPFLWAQAQDNLGNALEALGNLEKGSSRYKEAVAAHRAALMVWTRELTPEHWAVAQHNLGNALWALSFGESGTARLEEAVAAYREALRIRVRERMPLRWAMTQNALGNALREIGLRETEATSLQEAVEAYDEALKEYTRGRMPLQWALVTGNQGKAMMLLAALTSDLSMVEMACLQLEAALAIERDGGSSKKCRVLSEVVIGCARTPRHS
jgi:tetratricopeptide (TPR) repeat protein